MRRVVHALVVGVGGALGASLRLAISEVAMGGETGFPWATVVVNVLGAAALGALLRRTRRERLSWFAGAGFCGGLTTMSTFAVDVVDLFEMAAPVEVIGYVTGTFLAGGAAFVVARGRRWPTSRPNNVEAT